MQCTICTIFSTFGFYKFSLNSFGRKTICNQLKLLHFPLIHRTYLDNHHYYNEQVNFSVLDNCDFWYLFIKLMLLHLHSAMFRVSIQFLLNEDHKNYLYPCISLFAPPSKLSRLPIFPTIYNSNIRIGNSSFPYLSSALVLFDFLKISFSIASQYFIEYPTHHTGSNQCRSCCCCCCSCNVLKFIINYSKDTAPKMDCHPFHEYLGL